MNKTLIPQFGPFQGMRVLGTGSLIAMPFAASMLAEFGAQVIEIERPGVGDTYRRFGNIYTEGERSVSASWIQDARNRLSMTLELDMNIPDSKEIFFGLIKQTDIYLENMVWLERMGIKDADIMNANPKIVIVHISGYGHKEFGGIPETCDQASYDMIGQAYSGFVLYNGWENTPPLVVKPSLNDYITAMFALFGALAAYTAAQQSGRGQVVDISQFESQAKLMRDAFTSSTLGFEQFKRCGSGANTFQPWDLFEAAGDSYICIGAFGPAVFERFVTAIDFDKDKYTFAGVSAGEAAVSSPLGREFDANVRKWCLDHTPEQIEAVMRAHKVPCSRVNTPQDCLNSPQYRLRNDFISYTDQTLQKEVTAFGVFPKLSQTPGRVWRGAPSLGQDTDRILKELLGFDGARIEKMRENGVI